MFFGGLRGTAFPLGRMGFHPTVMKFTLSSLREVGFLESAPFPQERRFNEADPRGRNHPLSGEDDNHFGGFCGDFQLKITHPFWRKWQLSLLELSLWRKIFFILFFYFFLQRDFSERELPFPPKWVGNFQLKFDTRRVALFPERGC